MDVLSASSTIFWVSSLEAAPLFSEGHGGGFCVP